MINLQKNNPSVLHTQNSSPYTGEPSFLKKSTYVFLDIVCYYAHGGSSEPPFFMHYKNNHLPISLHLCLCIPISLIIFFIADNVVVI